MSVDISSFPEQLDAQKWFLPAKNNLRTQVLSPVIVSQNNVINVESTNGFPQEGIISIAEEVIYYRSKTGNSFRNLIRGFDGTFADSHGVGSFVELRWVAGHHNRSVDAIRAIQRTMGVNPQGPWPNLRSRLDAMGNTTPRRTDIIPLRNNGSVRTSTGYNPGPHLARLFRSPDDFIALTSQSSLVEYDLVGPEVHIDGLRQERGPTVFLDKNLQISSIDVSSRVVSVSSGNFISSGAQPGDLIVIKQTASNNDAYVIQSVDSASQVTVTEDIFGSNSTGEGVLDIISTSDTQNPFKDYVCINFASADPDASDAIVFLDPPDVIQTIRMDYSIKSSISSITYENPVAAQATYQAPSNSGAIAVGANEVFVIPIGKPRAIAFRVRLSGASENVDVEIFGKSDLTEMEYLAQYIDLTIGEFNDYGLWHFHNRDDPQTYNMYVRITNNGTVALNYMFEIELEALGDYA